jgi:hypothetical protein
MITLIAEALGLNKLAVLLIGCGIAATFLIGVVGWYTYDVYERGVTAEIARQERVRNEARETAIRAARTVRACYDAGGLWFQSNGRCVMPTVRTDTNR